jgi:hypothetical protein
MRYIIRKCCVHTTSVRCRGNNISRLIFSKESLPFPFIAAIVRLGRKYEFRNLLAAAVQRLTHENPTTLEAYTRLIASRMSYKATKIEHDPALIFDTIALARENDLSAVLPCAYLRATIFHTRVRTSLTLRFLAI